MAQAYAGSIPAAGALSGISSVWLERFPWKEEAAGSSPASLTDSG